MPRKSSSAKTYCTLRDAFDLVGKHVFGSEWAGEEACTDSSRERIPSDTRTLLHKRAPDGSSFLNERLPPPPRPIDEDDGRLKSALERHGMALKALVRLLHDGRVTSWFIPDDDATTRKVINPSSWPDPEGFNPKDPTFGALWFSVATSRGALKPPSGVAPDWYERFANTEVWHYYSPMKGHIEVNRGSMKDALESDDKHKIPRKKPANERHDLWVELAKKRHEENPELPTTVIVRGIRRKLGEYVDPGTIRRVLTARRPEWRCSDKNR